MEFGVALFGAVASVVLSKLLNLKGKPNTDVTFIMNDLSSIAAVMQDHARDGHTSYLWTQHIAQLRDLAYDIEDCIDRFNAKKMSTEKFAHQIAELRKRSTEATDRIQRFSFRADRPAAGGGGGGGGGGVAVPTELQNLAGDYNLNCLLYLCLFPPNHRVRRKPLIRRWLAEGLVQEEEVAEEYLDMFINSTSIINIDSIQTSNNGKVKRCQPTDEMLVYISQRSISENFILLCGGRAQLQTDSARRLSVYPSPNGQLILPRNKLPHLRTLAVFPDGTSSPDQYEAALDFTRYGVLRVLDLKECADNDMGENHLQRIWDQVLIKYLSINLGSIASISRQIGYLEQLETLDLSGSVTVTVFKEVLLLPKLKHLLGKFQLSKADTLWRHVPSDVRKSLSQDSVLETMAGFVIGGRLGFPQLMSFMRMLRKVKIWCQYHASQENLDDISSAITKFIIDGNRQPDLDRSLSIDFEKCPREFVNGIHSARGILTSLKLRGHLTEFPQFVAHLSSVVELCLSLTSLSWKKIRDGLSRVRGLKYLKLIEDNLESLDILSEADHLNAIERIYVVCKKKLEIAITVAQLVSVHILCKDLHVIPGTSGIEIKNMTNLEEVALHDDVHTTISSKLKQAADDHPKRPNFRLIKESLIVKT